MKLDDQELDEKVNRFRVQMTLRNILFERLENLEIKSRTEGLTSDEEEEYTRLIGEVGQTTRYLEENSIPLLEEVDKKVDRDIQLRDHYIVAYSRTLKRVEDFIKDKGLMDEYLWLIDKRDLEEGDTEPYNALKGLLIEQDQLKEELQDRDETLDYLEAYLEEKGLLEDYNQWLEEYRTREST